jgi:hypothetical protein
LSRFWGRTCCGPTTTCTGLSDDDDNDANGGDSDDDYDDDDEDDNDDDDDDNDDDTMTILPRGRAISPYVGHGEQRPFHFFGHAISLFCATITKDLP